jgi:hypothetical protein
MDFIITGGTPHLTEKILNLLDARSLANAELVCTQGRTYIAVKKCWKKFLLKNDEFLLCDRLRNPIN